MLPPEVAQALGLSDLYAPVPVRWKAAKLQTQSITGVQTLHVLAFEDATGTHAVTLDDATALALAAQLHEQATGIAIASTVPTIGNN